MTSSTAARALGGATDLQRHMILLAASGGDPIRGKVRLQHMVFMASNRSVSSIPDAGFRAGGRGPHSETVEAELARLVEAGIFTPGDGIGLTAAGREAAEGIAKDIPAHWNERTMIALRNFKEHMNELDDDEVQVFSYCAYPHMTAHGDEYKRLEPRTEEIVLGMAEAEKVSIGRAAELLQVPMEQVWDEMMRRGAVRLSD